MLIHISIITSILLYDTISLVLNPGARAITPDTMDFPVEPEVDHASDPLDSPQSPHIPEAQGRQKSTAVKSFCPSAFPAKISAPLTRATVEIIKDVRGHYAVPDGESETKILEWSRMDIV